MHRRFPLGSSASHLYRLSPSLPQQSFHLPATPSPSRSSPLSSTEKKKSQAPSARAATPPKLPCRPGRSDEFRPPLTASRRVIHPEEQFPSLNLDNSPPDQPRAAFLSNSGRHRLHRRRFFSGHPLSNYFLCEHHLDSLYLPQPLTRSLFFPRSPPPLEHPRRPRSPSPAQLRYSPLPRSTPTSEYASRIIDDRATSLSEQYKQAMHLI